MMRLGIFLSALLVAPIVVCPIPLAFAASDSRFDMTLDKATRLIISEETLDQMIAHVHRLASKRIVQDLNALPFLEDAKRLLAIKRRQDETIAGLEFTYTSDGKDCNLYYRSKSGRAGVQKTFWKQEGSCQLLEGVVFTAFLQTVMKRKSALHLKVVYIESRVWWATDDVVALARHPELERVMAELGLQVITFPVPVKEIKVEYGDTLWGIASREGQPEAWKFIGATSAASFKAKGTTSIKRRLATWNDWNKLEVGDEIYAPAWLGTKTQIQVHRISSGETLEDVSEKQFGKKDYWGLVYLLNRHQLADIEKLPNEVMVPESTDFILKNTKDVIELKALIEVTTPPETKK